MTLCRSTASAAPCRVWRRTYLRVDLLYGPEIGSCHYVCSRFSARPTVPSIDVRAPTPHLRCTSSICEVHVRWELCTATYFVYDSNAPASLPLHCRNQAHSSGARRESLKHGSVTRQCAYVCLTHRPNQAVLTPCPSARTSNNVRYWQ